MFTCVCVWIHVFTFTASVKVLARRCATARRVSAPVAVAVSSGQCFMRGHSCTVVVFSSVVKRCTDCMYLVLVASSRTALCLRQKVSRSFRRHQKTYLLRVCGCFCLFLLLYNYIAGLRMLRTLWTVDSSSGHRVILLWINTWLIWFEMRVLINVCGMFLHIQM